ncbi:hypothetical protein NX059_005921 [Plenodomus lindquistii]|nr:hypothetical protein NX059_005921 [Plenodomus lindquistii]
MILSDDFESIHIYYFQEDKEEVKFANELWERIRREFPELRIYKVWDKPIGPHPVAMFEVNVFTPGTSGRVFSPMSLADLMAEQFGAFIPWLVINRGPLSALIHPNTDDEERDHTQRATWMGAPLPLNLKIFKTRKVQA